MANENLGAAERIIQTLIAHKDHMVHNRPGMVVRDTTNVAGVRWTPVIWKLEEGSKVVYRKDKTGAGKAQKTTLVKVGVLRDNGDIYVGAVKAGRYMDPGLFPETCAWVYRQIADVWKLDNEFAAKWASYAFQNEDSRDLRVAMAAFLLVQSRKGDPVLDEGKVAFHDDDFRDVGEAMLLLDGAKHFDVKLLLRIHDLLELPEIAAINRELGFGNSARHAFLGRFSKAAEKWLRYREENPKILEGLIKKGFRTSVKRLAEIIGYKPTSVKFFMALRWKQTQAKDGRRSLAIGAAVKAAESWKGLTEEQIGERILATKPDFKRIVGLLPEEVGLTRAVMAAAIEAGSLSDKDLIIYTPTLEELGLLKVPEIQGRWQKAIKQAEDMRAAHIATRVKSKEAKEALGTAADTAVQKAVEEVVREMEIYVYVDISGSMDGAIERAVQCLTQMLPAFPLAQLHVSVFNTVGREIAIKAASSVGVLNAFKGIKASGGTDHGSGVRSQMKNVPAPGRDVLFLWIGDEGESSNRHFTQAIRTSGLNPVAFGVIPVVAPQAGRANYIRQTAAELGIPCFDIDERIFNDAYEVPRTLRNLIAATPVGVRAVAAPARESLVDLILKTPLLQKPAWAA